MRLLPVFAASFLLAVAACGSDTDTSGLLGPVAGSGGSGPGGLSCVSGKQEACACPGGVMGVQVCRADGAGFTPCECGAGGSAGSGGSGNPGGAGGSGAAGGSDGKGGSDPAGGGAGGLGGSGPLDPNDADADADGWTPAAGDCDDQDAQVNPAAFEVAGNAEDDDCNGKVDDASVSCDAGLPLAPGSAEDVARALGLCKVGVPAAGAEGGQRLPGVIGASYSDINGPFRMKPPKVGADTTLQLGTLPDFGPSVPPREGFALFALSSGVARATGQEGAEAQTCSGTRAFASNNSYPPGFPKNGDCGTTGTPNDGIAVDLELRVPSNAKSFRLRFKFLTCEFPAFVCKSFNDVFAILMSPSPLAAGDPMADATNATANIAFEVSESGLKNVIGVNNTSFFTDCKDGAEPKYKKCAGESSLVGTGFESHAASAWLETQVPIPAFAAGADRIINLRFAIWDSADYVYNSTALVDGFEWQTTEVPDAVTVVAP